MTRTTTEGWLQKIHLNKIRFPWFKVFLIFKTCSSFYLGSSLLFGSQRLHSWLQLLAGQTIPFCLNSSFCQTLFQYLSHFLPTFFQSVLSVIVPSYTRKRDGGMANRDVEIQELSTVVKYTMQDWEWLTCDFWKLLKWPECPSLQCSALNIENKLTTIYFRRLKDSNCHANSPSHLQTVRHHS